MWNPFKKKELVWQSATLYDYELEYLEDYYGSNSKALAKLLQSKGIPCHWNFTMMLSNQWVSIEHGYKVEVERDDRSLCKRFHWIKKDS